MGCRKGGVEADSQPPGLGDWGMGFQEEGVHLGG